MAEQSETGISWTDETWNPIRGCSRVSQGCVNCYAERVAARFSGNGLAYEGLTDHNGRWNGTVRVIEEHMEDPIRWRRPRRIFVNSMSDLFHENLPFQDIARVFEVMAAASHHTFQVLTKRAGRMAEWFRWSETQAHPEGWRHPLPNVHLGVSVENQKAAEDRIVHLLECPAVVRFLSVEPMLGPVDLAEWLLYRCAGRGCTGGNLGLGCGWAGNADCTEGRGFFCPECGGETLPHAEYVGDDGLHTGIHWVIVGGESGTGARPMQPDWARKIRDQCAQAEVAFHFKQWGEWGPSPLPNSGDSRADQLVRRGKRNTGRELDGRTWDEFPRGVSRG